MTYQTNGARALFLAADGEIYPDVLICSGVLPAQLHGEPCPYAQNGRMPTPLPLNKDSPDYDVNKGEHGDLCPPCALYNLSSLGSWQGASGRANWRSYPKTLRPLRLFKCKQWLWLVVPGLYEAEPTQILHISNQ
jgi:hypothetical protein